MKGLSFFISLDERLWVVLSRTYFPKFAVHGKFIPHQSFSC